MKKVDLFQNIQVNKVCSIVAIALISLFITACAGNKVSSDEAIDEPGIEYYRDSQQKWLASLKEGMSLEDALKPVLPYQNYFYQRKESGHLFQYIEGMFPKTGMLFGLFFEDGQLTSLLLDQSVYDLNSCRSGRFNPVGSWHTQDFEITINWVREQNRLGDEYDDVSTEYRPDDSKGSGDVADTIIEGILWTPLYGMAPGILLAQAFMPEDKTEYYKQSEHLHELSNKIEPGVTNGKDVIQILGKPQSKYQSKYTSWDWSNGGGNISVGYVDETVHWTGSETYFWQYTMRNNVTFKYKNKNCLFTN